MLGGPIPASDKPIAVLLSGGLDSSVVLALACKARGPDLVHALSINYGQTHSRELAAAAEVASDFKIREHFIAELYMLKQVLGKSPLTETGSHDRLDLQPTWIPGRNIVQLAILSSWAYSRDIHTLTGGWNVIDYSGYPDCREEFLIPMARALSNGLDHFTSIIAPILMASKADIIKIGQELDVPFEYTWSCYEGLRRACGKCASCKIRLAGFEEAGLVDPVLYEG